MGAEKKKFTLFMSLAVLYIFVHIPLSAQTSDSQHQVVTAGEDKGTDTPAKTDIKINNTSQPVSPVSASASLTDESESNRIFRRDLIVQVNEIIKKVQSEYPVLSRKLDARKQKEILKAVVSALNSGMRYVSADDPEDKPTDNKNSNPAPGIMLASNKILYIRVDSFSDESLKQLKKDCENCAEFENRAVGVIIDLRNSQGYDYNSAIDSAALFIPPEEMAKHNLKTPIKQLLTEPVILLTGSKTKGAAEIFTKLLFEAKRAISLGETTAGVPFEKRKVTLTNGDWLLIPQVPDKLAEVLPEPIKPSIKFTPYPQLKYELLKERPGAETGDKCIERALELILCLDALKHE